MVGGILHANYNPVANLYRKAFYPEYGLLPSLSVNNSVARVTMNIRAFDFY